MLGDWLRAAFQRRAGDIGLVRTAKDLARWTGSLPRLPCGTAPDGARGVFAGTVRAHAGTVVAPLSQRPCVLAAVTRTRLGEGTTHARVSDFEVSTEFCVEDASGRALVRPELVSLLTEHVLTRELSVDCESAAALSDWIRRMTATAPQSHPHPLLPVIEYAERRLVDGDPVLIVGSARRELDPFPSDAGRGGYRDMGTRVVIEPAPDAMFLYVTEDAGAG